jgi:hypothetical protein
MTIQFESFPKLHRFTGPIVITEKIDGTNACVVIDGSEIAAQSRTRIITPEKDNFGFARWVHTNKDVLIELLGDGRHYGEWWGNGIQRGYGLKEKRFSLFNTVRWNGTFAPNNIGVHVVPVLWTGAFDTAIVALMLDQLKARGSYAAPGYDNPEGIVVYDTRSGQGYKKTFDYDDTGKGMQKDEHGNVLEGSRI